MLKLKKSFFEVINEAEDFIRLHPDYNNLFINLRNITEITKLSWILRASNVLRVLLDLYFNSKCPYDKEFFNKKFYFIFYYASVLRSALATKSAEKVGLLNTSYILCEYTRWLELSCTIGLAAKL